MACLDAIQLFLHSELPHRVLKDESGPARGQDCLCEMGWCHRDRRSLEKKLVKDPIYRSARLRRGHWPRGPASSFGRVNPQAWRCSLDPWQPAKISTCLMWGGVAASCRRSSLAMACLGLSKGPFHALHTPNKDGGLWDPEPLPQLDPLAQTADSGLESVEF
jgi:hypothetical protein